MARLTDLEVWTLARVRAGYQLTTRSNLSKEVIALSQHISTLSFQDRSFHLQMNLSKEDFSRVDLCDTESPPPMTQQTTRRWQIIPASQLADLPKASWLLPPVLPEASLTVLFGPSGTYKSFMALDYALQVAQSGNAIYTIYEGLSGYHQRIKAWAIHNRKHYGNLFVCLGSLALMDTSEVSMFIEDARQLSPKLIVVDTLARAMTGSDENSSRDMGMFISACERVRLELNCCVLIVHHTGKTGLQERGSGALRGAADMMIKQSLDDDVIVVSCDKSKDSEPFEPMYFRPLLIPVMDENGTRDVPVLEAAESVIVGEKLSANQRKVMEVLALEIFEGVGASAVEITESIPELTRGSVYRVLSRLSALKLVTQRDKRSPFTLTNEGMTRLSRLSGVNPSNEQSGQSGQPSHSRSNRMFNDSVVSSSDYYAEGL